MQILLSLLGRLVTTAHAETLDKWGSSNAGVQTMWQTIKSSVYVGTYTASNGGVVRALAERAVIFLLPLIAAAAVLLIVYAGIRIISSRGQEDQVTEGKTIITYALAGVALALLGTTILGFFYYTFFPILLD
jgi:hypothetical protein